MFDQQNRVWVLVLNKYQRDNLLWLLNMIGYGKPSNALPVDVERFPFHLFQTGDWTGEVAIKLGEFEPEPTALFGEDNDDHGKQIRKPNKSRSDLVKEFAQWMDQRFLDFMTRTCSYGGKK